MDEQGVEATAWWLKGLHALVDTFTGLGEWLMGFWSRGPVVTAMFLVFSYKIGVALLERCESECGPPAVLFGLLFVGCFFMALSIDSER